MKLAEYGVEEEFGRSWGLEVNMIKMHYMKFSENY